MEQITALLGKIESLEQQHKQQIDELRNKSSSELKLNQVGWNIEKTVTVIIYLQDKLTESQAEVSSLRDENAHQTGRCSSIQQRLREAEARVNAQHDELDVRFHQVKLTLLNQLINSGFEEA